ncbi:site-specific integrase [Desulfobacterota bacterium AH_259_B03_O07]|nr:site-specific integrase [Desulfobacterota bacterium AH_259_B03_O07]
MGSVFLRGSAWVGEYRDRGKIKRKALGNKRIITKTMAREMLKKIEQQVKLGQYDMLDAEIPTFKEFSKDYVEYQKDVKRIRSHNQSRVAVNYFSAYFGDNKLSTITAEDIDIYKQGRLDKGAKPGTIKRELNVIKNLFNRAKRWKKFFGENPVSQSGMPEVHDQKERVLSMEEEKRLIEAIPEEFKGIILIALNTGMRLGEILGLKWKWVDSEESLINLPQTHTKTKKSRKVPINPTVRRILLERKLKSGGSEFVFQGEASYSLRGKLQRSFKEACKRAEITDLRFHDLRHTVGTRLGEEGVPIQTISKLLGHTSTKMTERYVHPEESVKKATDILANFSESLTDKSTDIKDSE